MNNSSPMDRGFMEISRQLDLARKESRYRRKVIRERDKDFQEYKNERKELIESLLILGIAKNDIDELLYDFYLNSKEDALETDLSSCNYSGPCGPGTLKE